MATTLTQREFSTWKDLLLVKMIGILDHMDKQLNLKRDHIYRLANELTAKFFTSDIVSDSTWQKVRERVTRRTGVRPTRLEYSAMAFPLEGYPDLTRLDRVYLLNVLIKTVVACIPSEFIRDLVEPKYHQVLMQGADSIDSTHKLRILANQPLIMVRVQTEGRGYTYFSKHYEEMYENPRVIPRKSNNSANLGT